MLQDVFVVIVALFALAYLIRRFFFKRASCDRCGMDPSKKH